eukprot:Em0137g4a
MRWVYFSYGWREIGQLIHVRDFFVFFRTSIISGHLDKRIRFWDARGNAAASEIALPGKVTSLDHNPDRQLLLCCSRDDTLRLIDLRQNSIMSTFSTSGFKVSEDWSRACFSPDGQYVAAGSADGSVFVWEVASGRMKSKKEHTPTVCFRGQKQEDGSWLDLDPWLDLDGSWLDLDGSWLGLDGSWLDLDPWVDLDGSWLDLDPWLDLDGSWLDLDPWLDLDGSWLDLDGSWLGLDGSWLDLDPWVDLDGSWLDLDGPWVDLDGSWLDLDGPCLDLDGSWLDLAFDLKVIHLLNTDLILEASLASGNSAEVAQEYFSRLRLAMQVGVSETEALSQMYCLLAVTWMRNGCRFQKIRIFKDKEIGRGAYGMVCKAECDGLLCAAKLLHPVLTCERTVQSFHNECQILSSIKHPNIIQYLGTHEEGPGNPVLLMELLATSLTALLEESPSSPPLPFHTAVNLCHDVSLALAYLHSNDIIHRDLSSNNVLLTKERKAKVTDFGMCKLLGGSQHVSRLTQVPGCAVYMPPEAQMDRPTYTYKLDSFSYGVLTVQMLTRKFPAPGPPRKRINDPRYGLYPIEVPIPEPERRKSHIDLIDPFHPLLKVALVCLSYEEKDRPSSSEICSQVGEMKRSERYREGVLQEAKGGATEELHRQVSSRDVELLQLRKQLESSEREKKTLKERIDELTSQLDVATTAEERATMAEKELLEIKQQKGALQQQIRQQVQRAEERGTRAEKELFEIKEQNYALQQQIRQQVKQAEEKATRAEKELLEIKQQKDALQQQIRQQVQRAEERGTRAEKELFEIKEQYYALQQQIRQVQRSPKRSTGPTIEEVD